MRFKAQVVQGFLPRRTMDGAAGVKYGKLPRRKKWISKIRQLKWMIYLKSTAGYMQKPGIEV